MISPRLFTLPTTASCGNVLSVRRVILLVAVLAGARFSSALAGDFSALQSFRQPRVVITAAELIPAGSYKPPGAIAPFAHLPAFCRVAATLKPTADSDIKIELWLPQENWNGRFLGTGNGGSAGNIVTVWLDAGLRRNFAVVNTDMGTSPNAELYVGHPERWADFGYRATHEMTLVAKKLTERYYGRAARFSYFIGGSTGGQQALMEAQRFPEDYDGIIAGSPAFNRTHLHAMFVWNWQAMHATAAIRLTPAVVASITKAAVANGVGKDGGAPDENFLNDPRLSTFDPASLAATAETANTAAILTTDQVVALRRIYAGPVNARTGEKIFTGPPIGSEESMYLSLDTKSRPPHSYLFRWVLGSEFDLRSFDFDRHLAQADQLLAPGLNANNPDLTAFRRRGGKLVMFSGTADGICPFQDAVAYYERVITAEGGLEATQSFFRFFIVPGLGHVSGGPGPNEFGQSLGQNLARDKTHDIMAALMGWVEAGVAPRELIATTYESKDGQQRILRQRPTYPYPDFPHYKGGDSKSAASFNAVAHPRGAVEKPADTYLH